jgi:hypothetical protein
MEVEVLPLVIQDQRLGWRTLQDDGMYRCIDISQKQENSYFERITKNLHILHLAWSFWQDQMESYQISSRMSNPS